jgi:hypothetical protein
MVIDAAGAIYVIGGHGSSTYYNDVWISTDGGADRTRAGVLEGYSGLVPGVVQWCSRALARVVTRGTLRSTHSVLKGY